jgi:hypothetical protein
VKSFDLFVAHMGEGQGQTLTVRVLAKRCISHSASRRGSAGLVSTSDTSFKSHGPSAKSYSMRKEGSRKPTHHAKRIAIDDLSEGLRTGKVGRGAQGSAGQT